MSMVEQQLWEEGRDQVCVKREERGSFYRRGRSIPLGGVPAKEEFLLLFMSLFMVVTPSST